MIWLLANVYHSEELLQPFLRYYRAKGVDRFVLVAHEPIKLHPDRWIHIEYVDEPYISGPRDNQLLNALRKSYVNKADWYIPADLDEFHWTPGLRSFHDLFGDYDYVASRFVDRVSLDGKIYPVKTGVSLWKQFPLMGNIIGTICGGCVDKVALLRGSVPCNSGHHYAEHGVRAPFVLQTHHFKFCGHRFWQWMFYRESLVNYSASREVSPFLEHFRCFGRINIYDSLLGFQSAPDIGV